MEQDDWRWHMFDTVRGSDWLGDQERDLRTCGREAVDAVVEARSIWAVPFSRNDAGEIYQRRFRPGHTTEYAKGVKMGLSCLRLRPIRTGQRHPSHALPAMPQAQKARFFIEYFCARPADGRGTVSAAALLGLVPRGRLDPPLLTPT